ncbi:hypothetical protein BS78_05G180700 [Paspalum vaginatum]|nr:hypothetical protein BS78_05G180700 [Paspalum vaginatum]
MRPSATNLLLLIATCCFLHSADAGQLDRRPAADEGTPSCIPKERDALLEFKHGINDTNNLLVSWQHGQDCCRWVGVTCSHHTGHVLRLDLSDATLLDDSLDGQQLSPSLLSLEHLEYLDLSTLTTIWPQGPNISSPEFLGSLKKLRHLDLSGGLRFSGGIPPQLANLSKLEYLDLSGSSFSAGRVPPELGNLSNLLHLGLSVMDMYSIDISWLSRLHLLQYLDMSYVNLSMAVDWPHVLNLVPSLKVLNLAECNLPRTNQTLAQLNLTKLVDIDLSSNYLGHPISSCWFWNVTTIQSLELSKTHLFGPFPSSLGRLASLQRLVFNDNGNSATMSVDLKDLSALQHLHLRGSLSHGNIKDLIDKLPHGNIRDIQQKMTGNFTSLFNLDLSDNHLTGAIPSGIANIIPIIEILDLSGNNITGAIPRAIRNCSSLDTLILHSNQLSGNIPILPRNLTRLDLSMNSLSGPLPLDIGALDLETIILSSNYITGQIPESICEPQYMEVLDLSNNFMEGIIPQCLQMQSMLFLLLSHNSFSGILPSSLQGSILAYMDLSWNKFNGTLPQWIGDLACLRFLQLSHNMFYGHIPSNITNLRYLEYLNLAGNNLSGAMPRSLPNLELMTDKHPKLLIDWFESYTGPESDAFGGIMSVLMKRQERNYGDRIDGVVGIDLSCNQLTGKIPDEITSLNRLLNLNLSWNQLSGNIVDNLGSSIKSLESLDLSRNSLSGEIPPSLADLTYLGYLDLSYNNLSGRIPQGRQLDTLYAEAPSMYDGNSGLCGPPLQRACSGGKLPENGNQNTSKRISESKFLYFGLGSGFIAGLWVVFCVLLFKRMWRIACFRIFDEICDKVYVFVIVTWRRFARKEDTGS